MLAWGNKASAEFREAVKAILAIALLAFAIPVFAQSGSALPPAGTDLQLQVKVYPRIGLFDPLYFSSSFVPHVQSRGQINYFPIDKGWRPLDERAYSNPNYLPANLLRSFPDEWQLLTYEGLYNNKLTAYSERSVRIVLTSKSGGALKNCTLTVSGKVFSPPYANKSGALLGPACEFGFRTDSNLQVPFIIEYETAAGLGTKATLPGVIPEDFLIVSIGDSYASGEGNPDIPKSPRDFAYSTGDGSWPIWMDNKCQRSAWSGPIQAGLKLIAQDKSSPALATGAYTIISLACSGGEIHEGITSEHDGPVSHEQYLKTRLPLGVRSPNENFEGDIRNRPQIEVLKLLLYYQSPDGSDDSLRKRTIDAMVVSVGGNDVFFGPLVKSLTLKTLTKQQLDELRPVAEDRLKRLRDILYPELILAVRKNLAWKPGNAATEMHLTVRHLLFTEYPDPTGDAAGKACNTYAAGAVSPLAEFVLGMGLISEQEATWAKEHVITKLNDAVKGAAESGGAVFVTEISKEFKGRGLCATGSSDPFVSQARWVRLPFESLKIQGNVNGAVHPTWEGHQVYSRQIHSALEVARTRRLHTRLNEDYEQGKAVGFIRSPFNIRIHEQHGDKFIADRTGVDRWCHTVKPTDTCDPAMQENAFLEHGQTVDLSVRAIHSETKNLWIQSLGRYLVDGKPPYEVDCEVSRPARLPVRCSNDGVWLAAGATLRSTVSDSDGQNKASGVHGLTATILASDKSIAFQQNTPVGAESFTLAGNDLVDGSFRLTLTATDRAGNVGKLRENLAINVDRTAPEIDNVTAYGASLKTLGVNGMALPVIRGWETGIAVTASDAIWGPRSITLQYEPINGVVTKDYRKTTSICNGFIDPRRQEFIGFFLETLVPGNYHGHPDGNIAIKAEDCNENTTSEPVRYRVVVIEDRTSGPLKSLQSWKDTPGNDPIRVVASKLTPLWGNPDPNWQSSYGSLLAAWLNVAAGLVAPGKDVESLALPPTCSQGMSTKNHSVWFALLAAEACGKALTNPDEREKFMAGLQNYFEQQKILAVSP